jgi:CHASE2 domain
MNVVNTFQLEVQRVEDNCIFKLSWGNSRQLKPVVLKYPERLTACYKSWKIAYSNFYTVAMRGKAIVEGGTSSLTEMDWRRRLVHEEVTLLSEFYDWLESPKLNAIRSEIGQANKALVPTDGSLIPSQWVNIFVSCNPLELEYLPWEMWELGVGSTIRIVRSPNNIRFEPIEPRKGRPRILVILGDDTGLNFQEERRAIEKQLKPMAEVVYIGWGMTRTNGNDLKTEILDALGSEAGWDMLLFFGHSDEASLTGGELAIAPQTWIALSEIRPQLLEAKRRGLQFALFNSCNGLSIASSLIDLGLSQVAIMREPIHNAVAQKFLLKFLQVLATHRDVYDAMKSAVDELKLHYNGTFPSAYLIPSLFWHREAALFRIEPRGPKQFLQQLIPTRGEAIRLGILVGLSLIPQIQLLLLEPRLTVQAIYRQVTQQVPKMSGVPPVLLVQIDLDSLDRANIKANKRKPTDRQYLASVVRKLTTQPNKIIGIDYELDQPTDEDPQLISALRDSAQRGNILILAATKNQSESQIATSGRIKGNRILSTDLYFRQSYLTLPSPNDKCPDFCPFAYVLAMLQNQNQGLPPSANRRLYWKSSGVSKTAFWTQPQFQLKPITELSSRFNQMWLHPIVDFSIPPAQVYERIPVWQVLESPKNKGLPIQNLQQILILASGGSEEEMSDDSDNSPMAIWYWRNFNGKQKFYPKDFTTGEYYAYITHHLLTRKLLIPIPDLWMIGLAVIFGKGFVFVMRRKRLGAQKSHLRTHAWFWGGAMVYGVVALQIFVSYAVVLPWLLPMIALGGYVLPRLRQGRV